MTATVDMPTAPFSRRASLPRTLLSSFLASLIIWQPLWLHATEVTPADANTQVIRAPAGTTVVNIATPNGSGLSHNRYGTFNVSEQGVILNNSREVVNTNLAGHIFANPNLVPGNATLILNEVVSQNPSSLLGAIEVAGQRADVVLANPNGITCNGCGFLNTSRATLSTGTPLIDGGSLAGFDVRGGTLSFEGAGGNMLGSERFDAIAGAIRLNADLHGHTIELRAGNQQVAYADLATTANDASLAGPAAESGAEFAISSSAVGGIYGDRIRLIANGAGVGVHLDAPVAAQLADVEISADGAVRFARVSAAGDVAVSGRDITAAGAASAGDELDLHATDTLTLAADTSEGRRVSVSAGTLAISEQAALAGRTTDIDAGTVNNAGTVRTDVLTSDTEHLANHGTLEGRHLTLTSHTLDNTDGTLNASGRLDISVDSYDHRGEVQGSELTLTSASAIRIDAEQRWQLAGTAQLNAQQVINEGVFSSSGEMQIDAATIRNDGDLAAQGELILNADEIRNEQQSLLLGGTDITLTTERFYNAGDLYANGALTIGAAEQANAQSITNESGLIFANGPIRLRADTITNTRLPLPEVEFYRDDPVFSFGDFNGHSQQQHEDCFLVLETVCEGFAAVRFSNISEHARFAGEVSRTGLIQSASDIRLIADTLINRYSTVLASGDLDIEADTVYNEDLRVPVVDIERIDRSWRTRKNRRFRSDRVRNFATVTNSEAPEVCDIAFCWAIRLDNAFELQPDGSAGQRATRWLEGTEVGQRKKVWQGVVNDCLSGVCLPRTILADSRETLPADARNVAQVWEIRLTDGRQLLAPSVYEVQRPDINPQPPRHEQLLGATLAAGGDVTITAQREFGNGSIERGADPAPLTPVDSSSLFRLDPLATGGFALPGQNGLFVSAPPGSGFLFQSNPLFTNQSDFLGSGFMLEHLGWNPNGNQILIGDANYELFLLQSSLAGEPQLAGMDQQQREDFFQQMMVDGIAAAESLALAVGVSLSEAQINALHSDIIWLEERQVAGASVLVPTVYFASGIGSRVMAHAETSADTIADTIADTDSAGADPMDTLAGIRGGIRGGISGDNVTLTAGTVSNNLGNIVAVDNLDITSTEGDLYTSGSLQAGQQLSLTSATDITVDSGRIEGGDVTLDATDALTVATAAFSTESNLGNQHTALGERASIIAHGNLDLASGADTTLRGAQLRGDTVAIDAGGELIIDTVEQRQSVHFNDGAMQSRVDALRHLGSDIVASLDLLMEAEQNILLAGANIEAGNDLALLAGGNIDIRAVEEHLSEYSRYKQKGGFGSGSTTRTREAEQHTLTGSTLTAGGNLDLHAGNDITVFASSAHAEGDVDIDAGGTVAVLSGVESDYERNLIVKKNAARIKTTDSGHYDETLAEATITSGGNLSIDGEHVALAAAHLGAIGDLNIGEAGIATDEYGQMLSDELGRPVLDYGRIDSIDIGTVTLNSEEWHTTTRELRGPVKALAVAQNAFLDISNLGLTALTGLDFNIETQSSSGTRETQQTEAVSWLGGDNLSLVANDSLYARGADLSADADMLLVSGGDVIWDAAIDQQTSHRYDNSEAGIGTSSEAFTRTSETTVNGVNASAGGSVTVMAGGDIQLIATDIEAGEDATLQADGSIALLSADEHYQSVSQVRGKGELGTATSLSKEELNRSVAIVSSIAANNIRISAGGDQYHAATTLSADNDIHLDAGGAIVFASVKDTEQYSIHSEGSDLLWMQVEGEGRYDESLRQAQIQAAGTLAINAAQGIRIDIKEVDQATVSETIAAMVENDPQLAWLKDMDARGDVDWQRIKEVHDAWDYESQGMGPGLALAVTIAATVLTGGIAASAGQAVAMSTNIAVTGAMGTAAGATAGAVVGGAVSAGITTAASSLAVGTINNGGRLDRALSDFTSSDSLKSTTASMLTAGITQGLLDPAFEKWRFGKITTTQPESVLSITKGFDLNRLDGMLGFTAHHAMQGVTSAGVSAAIQGGSFSDLLKSNLESQGNNVFSALAYNQVGNLGDHLSISGGTQGNALQYGAFVEGGLGRVALHSVTGGLITEATGGDFATGAAAAGLNQLMAPTLDTLAGDGPWRTAASQFTGIIGATLVGGDVNDGAWIAKQADTYNRQLHLQELKLLQKEELIKEFADKKGLSLDEASKLLIRNLAWRVDADWASEDHIFMAWDPDAQDFLDSLADTGYADTSGRALFQREYFTNPAAFNNNLMYADGLTSRIGSDERSVTYSRYVVSDEVNRDLYAFSSGAAKEGVDSGRQSYLEDVVDNTLDALSRPGDLLTGLATTLYKNSFFFLRDDPEGFLEVQAERLDSAVGSYNDWQTADERAALALFHGSYADSGRIATGEALTNISLSLTPASFVNFGATGGFWAAGSTSLRLSDDLLPDGSTMLGWGVVPNSVGFPEISVTTKINGNVVTGVAKPIDVRVGDPNRVSIIGRSMDAVEPYADTLRAQGIDVNVFSSADFTVPTYARKQWDLLRTQYNGRIPNDILPETQMFKANEGWAELIKYDNSTVINIGNPFNQGDSVFFNMEQSLIFGKH